MIGHARYLLGVFCVVLLPAGVCFWLLVHLFARSLRRLGPLRAYLVVLPLVAAAGAGAFRIRAWLLGADLGTNAILIAIAFAMFALTTPLELRYWRELKILTLVGVPELTALEPSARRLSTGGIYRWVRHPRYLSSGIGVAGNALIVNHAGMYWLLLCLFVAGYPLLLLEERELVDRFGDAYRQYQREVPQLIPRWRP